MLEIEEPNSIIFCGFSTLEFDIMFGFYKVTAMSELSKDDEVSHLHLEEIFRLSKLDSSFKPVKVSFIAKDPGLYKIVWSNEHSWFKGKTLKYRISTLKPVKDSKEYKAPVSESVASLSNLTSSKRKVL